MPTKVLSQDQALWIRLQNQSLVNCLKRPSSVVKRLIAIKGPDHLLASMSIFARCPDTTGATIRKTLRNTSLITKCDFLRFSPTFIHTADLGLLRNSVGDWHLIRTTNYLSSLKKSQLTEHLYLPNSKHSRLELFQFLKGVSPDSQQEMLDRLFVRYIYAYGPASVADFSHWTGLSSEFCNKLGKLPRSLVRAYHIKGLKGIFFSRHSQSKNKCSTLHILPPQDPILLGYLPRNLIISGLKNGKIFKPKKSRAIILLDGKVIATWKLERKARDLCYRVQHFRPLKDQEVNEINLKFRNLALISSAKHYQVKMSLKVR